MSPLLIDYYENVRGTMWQMAEGKMDLLHTWALVEDIRR